MVECDDTACCIVGEVTLVNAASILAELKPHIANKLPLLDFSGVKQGDSTVLALILSCKREAAQYHYPLRFSGFPASIITLADLYGVTPFIQA